MFVYFISFKYSNSAGSNTSRTEIKLENKISSIQDIQLVEAIIKDLFDGTMDIQVLWYEQLRKE